MLERMVQVNHTALTQAREQIDQMTVDDRNSSDEENPHSTRCGTFNIATFTVVI